MALERHVVTLEARDNLSPALKNAGQAAEQAGQQGQRAARDWGKALTVTGAAMGATLAVMSRLGQAHRSEEQQIRAVERAYGQQAETIYDLAASMQDLGIASDDAVRISALGAQSLAKNYGLTADQITQLIERSADLAAVTFDQYGRQLELTDVTQRLAAAIRGEGESAEILGLAMSDSALQSRAAAAGLTGWTTTMSEAEKAQFRFTVAMEDSATAQGAAAERFEGLVGTVNALKLQVGDAASTLGGFLGPVGESTAALGDLALTLPLIGAGAGKAASSLATVAKSAKTAQLATAALTLATGPVGLVAAFGLATYGAVKWYQSLEYTKVTTDDVATATDNFAKSIASLGMGGASQETLQVLTDTASTYADLGRLSTEYATQLGALIARENELNLERANSGDIDRINAIDAEIASMQNRKGFLEGMILTQDQYNEVQSDSINLLTNLNSLNADVVTARYEELWQQFRLGIISADELAWQINWLDENSATYGLTLDNIAKQQEINADAMNASVAGARNLALEIETLNREYSKADIIGHANALDVLPMSYKDSRDAALDYNDVVETGAERLATYRERVLEAGEAHSVFGAGVVDMHGDVLALDAALGNLSDTIGRDLPGAAGASYQRVVGFTDSIVDSIAKTRDWTDAMTGVLGTDFMDDGTWSKLSQMVQDGTLDQEDYTEALRAQESIYGDLTRAQDASAEIQIKQANVLAEGARASADYLVNIAALDEAEQELALAWADSDVASRAMEVATLAAEFGNMNAAQQEAFGSMVTSAAATDPALAAVLEDLGLIQDDINDPTGWALSVDKSAADTAIQDLTSAINTLAEVIGAAFSLDVTTSLDTSGFWGAYDALPNSKTINVYTAKGDYGFTPFALGGMAGSDDTSHAALGRMGAGQMSWVGEAGPELVHLPFGSTVTPNHASRYMDKGGGGVTFNGPVTVVANNPQQFLREMRTYTASMERR